MLGDKGEGVNSKREIERKEKGNNAIQLSNFLLNSSYLSKLFHKLSNPSITSSNRLDISI